jgi:hypothetical protein
VKLPKNVIIADDKLTRYLLAQRDWDDKSKFLSLAGFAAENPNELKAAILELAATAEAVEDGSNEYGVFYRADGVLQGVNGKHLAVTIICLRWHIDGSVHFVTLKPFRGKRS